MFTYKNNLKETQNIKKQISAKMEESVKKIKKVYKIFYCLITMAFVDIAKVLQMKGITQLTDFWNMPIIIQLITTGILMAPIITYITYFFVYIYFKITENSIEISADIESDIKAMTVVWGMLCIAAIPVLMIIGWLAAIGM